MVEKVKYTQQSDAEVVNFEGNTKKKKKHELKESCSEAKILHSWLGLSEYETEFLDTQHYMLCVSGDFD